MLHEFHNLSAYYVSSKANINFFANFVCIVQLCNQLEKSITIKQNKLVIIQNNYK